MSGSKGQPGTKPSNLDSPVPKTGADLFADAKESVGPDIPQAGKNLFADAQENGGGQAAQADQVGYQGPGSGALQTAADWAPTVGGVVGSIAGIPEGGIGAIPGATAGAMVGQGVRRLIETQILGKPANPIGQELDQVGIEGIKSGTGQLIGGAIFKAAGKVIGKIASGPANMIKTAVQGERDLIEKPAMDILSSKLTPMNTEQAGDAAKKLLTNHIQTKYGPFIDAYSKLDNVSKAMPVNIEARKQFVTGLEKWGAEGLSGDNMNMVRKFGTNIEAAQSGAQLEDAIGQISDAKNMAYRTGAPRQYAVLKELHSRANNFMEGETTKLAERIAAGKANPQEMGFLQQLINPGQAGAPPASMAGSGLPRVAAPEAKELAKEYLKSKKTISTDYKGFRAFLDDVGEQTKVKIGQGPRDLISNINDAPSEKLVERMFDPKNARALRDMQTETPEVYKQVVDSKFTQLVQKSSPNGDLDLRAVRRELFKMPPSARQHLISDEQLKALSNVVDNPKLESLRSFENRSLGKIVNMAKDFADISGLVKPKISPKMAAGANQALGIAVSPLVSAFMPGVSKP